MTKTAPKIHLTEKQKKILEKMSRATHGELHIKKRATIIIKSADGMSNRAISKEVGLNRDDVGKWRNRWVYSQIALRKAEEETPLKLNEQIKEILSDEYRSGRTPRITPEQIARILDLSLQSPESVKVPVTNWTLALLVGKVIELGIIESISSSQVRRFLKRRQI